MTTSLLLPNQEAALQGTLLKAQLSILKQASTRLAGKTLRAAGVEYAKSKPILKCPDSVHQCLWGTPTYAAALVKLRWRATARKASTVFNNLAHC